MYLDANNLYGWAMSQPTPCEDFKWLGGSTPHSPLRSEEVDLEYPEELHDLHNDYPCAPEKNCSH